MALHNRKWTEQEVRQYTYEKFYEKRTEEREMLLEYLDQPPDNVKDKLIMWIGVRNSRPTLDTRIHDNSDITIRKEVQDAKCYPAIIKWTTAAGKDEYAQINRPTKRAN